MSATIRFDKSQKYSPYYYRWEGRKYYFKTEEAAKVSLLDILSAQPVYSMTQKDKSEWHKAKQLLKGGSVLRAVESYVRTQTDRVTVTEAVKVYWRAWDQDNSQSHRDNCVYHINKFHKAADNLFISDIDDRWLQSYISPMTASMQGATLRHVYFVLHFAMRKQWIDQVPDKKNINTKKVRKKTPEFYDPETIERLIEEVAKTAPSWQYAFFIQLFCGIRQHEVCRLNFGEHVKLVDNDPLIDVSINVAKTAERRVIDWFPPRFLELLKTAPANGAVTGNNSNLNYQQNRKRFMKRVGVEPIKNGLRHTFCTLAVAHFQDANTVALLLGHKNATMLWRHYRNYMPKKQADKILGF